MTDEEALAADRHEWVCQQANAGHRTTINTLDAYAAGFRAGLKHARAWRPLNPYAELTWPEEGQLVVVKRGDMGALLRRKGGMLKGLSTSLVLGVSEGWSWLPLDEPAGDY